METKLSELHLGDFRKLYEFFDNRLGESYGVEIVCEDGGDIHEFADTMCIRIYKESHKAMIRIYDPAYSEPSEDGKVIAKIIINENDYDPETKEIALARMEEDAFFVLIKKIVNFELIYPNNDDNGIDEMEKELDNESAIKLFKSWVKEL